MAEPQIDVRVVPLNPGRPELGAFVGWHCWWKGQEYGHVTTRLHGWPPEAAEFVAALTGAKADDNDHGGTMSAPDPATEHVCRTEVELEQGGWFWRCTSHALGQFGMVSRDDAEFEASEHRRRFQGKP